MFGNIRDQLARKNIPAMPGDVSGYGGGTWNTDGSQATPMPGQAGPVRGYNPAGTRLTPLPTGDGLQEAAANPRSPYNPPGGPLGGSMRQPFDYDAALVALAGDQSKPDKWRRMAGVFADALAGAAGQPPNASRMLSARRSEQQTRLQDAVAQLQEWKYRDWARQNEADLGAAAPFTIGRDRLAYDPASGQTSTIYDGPEDFELYAAEMGLEPGTDEYFNAVEDYVLRSSGPSAFERDKALDDYRTANDERMEGVRFGNRASLERQRQGNRIDLRRTPAAPRQSGGGNRGGSESLPTFSTPQAALSSGLPKGTRFRTPDGKVKLIP